MEGESNNSSAWKNKSFQNTFDKSNESLIRQQKEKAVGNSEKKPSARAISQDVAEMRVAAENVGMREMTVDDILNDPNNRFKNMSRDEAELKLVNLRLNGKDKIPVSADKKPVESSITSDDPVVPENNNISTEKNEEKKGFFSRLKDKFKREEKPQDTPKVYGKVDPEVQEMRDMNAKMDQYNQQKIEENKPPQYDANRGKFVTGDPTTNFLNLNTERYRKEIDRSSGKSIERMATEEELQELKDKENAGRILDEPVTSPDQKQLFVSWSGKDEKYVVRIKNAEGNVNSILVDSEAKVREMQDRFRETGEISNDNNSTSKAA